MAMGYARHAPLDLPPGVDKRPIQRGARLPPLPPGHSARTFVTAPGAKAGSENPSQAAPRQSRQKKVDVNAILAQLQAFREAKAKAVEEEDYTEASRLKQLIAELEAALEGVDLGEPLEPPHPPATVLAGSVYDLPQPQNGTSRKQMPPVNQARTMPSRSQKQMRGSPDLLDEPSHAATSTRGVSTHLRDASEAAQACVPPKGRKKARDGTTPSPAPPAAPQPEERTFQQLSEEAIGFETDDLLQGIVERNLLEIQDVPSSAETVEDADRENDFWNSMIAPPHAAWIPEGPAPTLDDLLGRSKRALRPVKEPSRGRSRPRPHKNSMRHVSGLPPEHQDDDYRRGLAEKTRMSKRLDAIDRRQPFTAR